MDITHKILKESAKVNIGYKKPKPKSENDDIVMLSSMQKEVQKQIESNNDDRVKKCLKRYSQKSTEKKNIKKMKKFDLL